MIDAAIVGLGRWGKTLLEAVQGTSGALRFTHAVSRDPGKLGDYAAKHRLQLVDALEPVLADPKIKAVVLATPHSLHCAQIIAAAASGKAVFCEKPLTLTKAERPASRTATGEPASSPVSTTLSSCRPSRSRRAASATSRSTMLS